MSERKLVDKLKEFLNKKYGAFLEEYKTNLKEECWYRVIQIGNKLSVSSCAGLPSVRISNDELEITSYKFWETDELIGNMRLFRGFSEEFIAYALEKRENWKKYENSKI
ncbi:MAG: hypothetical protein ACP5LN_10630, partial [Thermoproteota archaeon]